MGLLRRFFGPAVDEMPPPADHDGHRRAPDASPDEVVLPKEQRSSRRLVSGKPPAGWKRQASDATGGPLWEGTGQGGHHFGGDGDGGGSGGY